jgi:hypothetical protein
MICGMALAYLVREVAGIKKTFFRLKSFSKLSAV